MLIKHFKTARKALQQERQAPSALKRSRDEYEFQPGYLEIVERPPAPWTRRTAMALTLLLVIALLWSVIGRLDIHARSAGRLIVSSHSKVIQSLESGEISAINVRDGQRVRAGDILITLNPIGVEAEVRELQEKLVFRQLEQSRLQALLTSDPLASFKLPNGVSPVQALTAHEHLQSEWLEVTNNLDSLNGEMSVNLANQQARRADIAGLEMLMTNIRARLHARQTLAANKLIPRMELLEQEREQLETDRALSKQHAEIDVLKAQYLSLKEQRESYLSKIRREYYDKLNQAQGAIAEIRQELVKANEKHRLQTLRSPVDGVVQQLSVHTLGGVIQAAQQLLVIVPDDAALEAEVMILNKDVGFVQAGQPVEIKVDSFPYTRYGTISGEVAHVSRDSVEDEQMGLVFPARVQIDRHTIAVDDKEVPLQAGMSITAEIRTGDRRVIDYLLSPLQQYQSEAMRER
ncbi:HlyD family type I secretion periplasmic adaptor subunit [Photobacterium alginatilyticum]|uniref:Membrane fusion protein (MFP) family protein n=1 Tax=Photobacterium alginatilyticum TaxID=1775171 RepID=A0ABW9YDK9_9GAMM|nr:HlyD family type I secretion periplasmic adaptor subunit [Photobacterium alginatilyticum]NBI51862.1 HlyD family type I secretion periplasmic adaptor subunit [Photobacterium alginatilyticum]